MTHYVARHSTNEWRLHDADGTEPAPTSWSNRPERVDLTDAIANAGPGGALLGQPDLRRAFVDVLSGEVDFRDLTVDGETVPWQ